MTSRAPRIEALDALRGMALFGILAVNFEFFAMPNGSFGSYGVTAFPEWWNRLAFFAIHFLFDGKFILIFSFLFGWGVWTQMTRSAGFRARYLRRLLGLGLIGLAHAALLFQGDILVSYAVLGLPLLLVRHWPPRLLVRLALLFWALSIAGHLLLGLLIAGEPMPAGPSDQEIVALHRSASFLGLVPYRVEQTLLLYLITPLLFAPQVMGMFVLGLASAKTFAATGIEAARGLAMIVLTLALVPALCGNAAYAHLSMAGGEEAISFSTVDLAARALFVPLLTLVYISAAALFLTRGRARPVIAVFGGEGRMSLTTYVGESALMGLIFNGYGLGLYGSVGPAAGLAVCVLVYGALLAFSKAWLAAFTMGPLEWLLRLVADGGSPSRLTMPAPPAPPG